MGAFVLAAVLALFTSVCYGTSNFVGPAISRDLPVYPVLIAGQAVAFVVSAAVLAVMQPACRARTVFLAAAAAGAGNAVGLICFYKAASLGPLSLVTPISSLGVIVPVAAGIASGESLGPLKLLGLLLALGGVALASRRAGGGAPGATSAPRRCGRWSRRSASGCSWRAWRPPPRTACSGR